MRSALALSAVAVVAVLTGCPNSTSNNGGPIKRPTTSDLLLHGTVQLASSNGLSNPAAGATVRAAVDRNGDKQISSDEAVTATADGLGTYQLQMKVNLGDAVVVSFSTDDAAPAMRSIVAGPYAELDLSPTLRSLDNLDCSSGSRCGVNDSTLSIAGLAPGLNGGARRFDPNTETSAFPGAFGDDKGNLLVSGVFSSVVLKNGNGDPVSTLASPADLRMELPKANWPTVVDITPNDGRIEVPLFAYDDVTGKWTRSGDGYLEDENGNALAETELGKLHDGSHAGSVVAKGQVAHFSYWNIDWPVEDHQCVTGKIVGDDGKPAVGATIVAHGLTYVGTSDTTTVGADGTFNLGVMRSEKPGEDLDQDGNAGETHTVTLRIAYAGVVYDGGKFDLPSSSAACGGGAGLAVGEVKLTSSNVLTPTLCKLSGKMVDLSGAPVPNAVVYAHDDSVPASEADKLCGAYHQNCLPTGGGSADGSFEVKLAVLDGPLIAGVASTSGTQPLLSSRSGTLTLKGCPADPITFVLNEGFDQYDVQLSLNGSQISWSPSLPAQSLVVSGTSGDKWSLQPMATTAIKAPVTYGAIPSGTAQLTPANNATPPALQSGDQISIIFDGTAASGYRYAGNGQVTVP